MLDLTIEYITGGNYITTIIFEFRSLKSGKINYRILTFIMRMKFLILYTLLIPFSGYSQKQERQILTYNLTFGAISSGIGAVINKPKNADWKKHFLKGAWQGSLGGLLNYSGKKMLYLINKKNEPFYAWPAKILHHAGISVIENAALNEPFLQNWNIDLGPVRIDFSTNNKRATKVRFLPGSIYAVVMGARNGKFDLSLSLKTGTMIYYSQSLIDLKDGNLYEGASFQRSFVYSDFFGRKNQVIAHEMTHIFQYSEYVVLNTWLKPLEKNVKSNFINKVFSKYVYADIPYFNLFYIMEGRPNLNDYYKNFFEFEAERFATNRYVPR